MKLTVFRYKVWDHQDDDHVHLEVDESDLDAHGRIAVRDEGQ
jgi:hypothetical protein